MPRTIEQLSSPAAFRSRARRTSVLVMAGATLAFMAGAGHANAADTSSYCSYTVDVQTNGIAVYSDYLTQPYGECTMLDSQVYAYYGGGVYAWAYTPQHKLYVSTHVDANSIVKRWARAEQKASAWCDWRNWTADVLSSCQ